MLQHVLVTPGAVRSSHSAGVPVIAWTVDENPDVQRSECRRGRDRDQRHQTPPGYTGQEGRAVGLFAGCGVAGFITALVVAGIPVAGADTGTGSTGTTGTTSTTTTTTTTTTTSTTTTTTVPRPPDVIAAGVRIGGTLVGGLSSAEATELVREQAVSC